MGFTKIAGFTDLEELRRTAQRCFPLVDIECHDIVEVDGLYYAVTMHGLEIQIVISKELIRYRWGDISGCDSPENIHIARPFPGIHGGNSSWNDSVVYGFKRNTNASIKQIYFGKKTGGPTRKYWSHNTDILLCLLFCDETRNDDKATYR